MRAPGDSSSAGETLLAVENVSLSFGGVKALKDVSLRHPQGRDPRHHRAQRRRQDLDAQLHQRLLHPQEGTITFKGVRPAARCGRTRRAGKGIARTFQNVALFKGMSTLDNIMTGRILKMKHGFFWQALYWGPA
jgi:branched-chain amino acid transport system ATP-binding protein